MSRFDKKQPPTYLQEARQRAGYINRGTASIVIPFSPETIGRHERGDIYLRPEDAVVYADGYRDPGVMRRYCSGCPVGLRIGRTATDRPLPYATLRVCYMMQKTTDVINTLEQVAFDGMIDSSEQGEFNDAVDFLKQLDESINDFLLVYPEKDSGPTLTQQESAPGAINHKL